MYSLTRTIHECSTWWLDSETLAGGSDLLPFTDGQSDAVCWAGEPGGFGRFQVCCSGQPCSSFSPVGTRVSSLTSETAIGMAGALPPELASLRSTEGPLEQERAWESFIGSYHALLLRVARYLGGDHDAIMDRYTFVLGELRRDNYYRLRTYQPKEAGKFELWLTTVARRLCLDHYRQQYGRPSRAKSADEDVYAGRQERRRLADLLATDMDIAELPASDGDPAASLAIAERARALGTALRSLQPEERLLLKLHYEEDLGALDIARILGLPSVFHVYRRRNAILSLLRRLLLRAGVGEAEP